MEHTPTPWKVSVSGGLIVPDNDNPVSTICRGFGRDEDDFPNWPANALRIVACVNACEGIPTEFLEGKSALLLSRLLINELRQMEAKNARLLEALKELVNATSDDFAAAYGFEVERNNAFKVIAEAEKTTAL